MSENNTFYFSQLFFIILSLITLAAPASAHVSMQPTAVSPSTMTADRLWASTASVLALVSVVIGGLALARAGRTGMGIGGLVLAVADGGPGTGNGVIGGAVALVLGLIGAVVGGLALARSRRTG